jgi:hypothetical protein
LNSASYHPHPFYPPPFLFCVRSGIDPQQPFAGGTTWAANWRRADIRSSRPSATQNSVQAGSSCPSVAGLTRTLIAAGVGLSWLFRTIPFLFQGRSTRKRHKLLIHMLFYVSCSGSFWNRKGVIMPDGVPGAEFRIRKGGTR